MVTGDCWPAMAIARWQQFDDLRFRTIFCGRRPRLWSVGTLWLNEVFTAGLLLCFSEEDYCSPTSRRSIHQKVQLAGAPLPGKQLNLRRGPNSGKSFVPQIVRILGQLFPLRPHRWYSGFMWEVCDNIDNIYLELQKQVNISLILSEDHMVWRLRTSEDASEGETSYLPGICVRTHIISNHIMDIVDMDMVDISNHIIYDAGVRAIHENILSGESDQRIKRRRIWRKPLLANFEITSIQGSIFGLRC